MDSRSPSAYFSAPSWEPVCAVGSHGTAGVNAQICVSISGVSIVEDMPRLMVTLWKQNYTHDLVIESRTMAVTLLTESQIDLLEPLGLTSGRNRPGGKLEGLAVSLSPTGDPYFTGGSGYVSCRLVDAYDLGDSTAFLVAVHEDQRLTSAEPMTWTRAQELADDDFLRRYEEKFRRDANVARGMMHWST